MRHPFFLISIIAKMFWVILNLVTNFFQILGVSDISKFESCNVLKATRNQGVRYYTGTKREYMPSLSDAPDGLMHLPCIVVEG